MAHTTQTANVSPPAKAGAQPITVSMAGVSDDIAEANVAANSGGTQVASQFGIRKPSPTLTPPVKTPAFDTVHTVTA